MAKRIRVLNAFIWIGGGIFVLIIWALAIVGAICLWARYTEESAIPPHVGPSKVVQRAALRQTTRQPTLAIAGYTENSLAMRGVVGDEGFEPPTSSM